MKVYVCGPVTGIADLNRPAFDETAARLAEAGMEAVLPHRFVPADATHDHAMRLCIARLCEGDIDALALLPGFADSSGACIEIDVACALGIPVCPICMIAPVEQARWWHHLEVLGEALVKGFEEGYRRGGE